KAVRPRQGSRGFESHPLRWAAGLTPLDQFDRLRLRVGFAATRGVGDLHGHLGLAGPVQLAARLALGLDLELDEAGRRYGFRRGPPGTGHPLAGEDHGPGTGNAHEQDRGPLGGVSLQPTELERIRRAGEYRNELERPDVAGGALRPCDPALIGGRAGG